MLQQQSLGSGGDVDGVRSGGETEGGGAVVVRGGDVEAGAGLL